jgi:ABC-type branched-subunit amino acid transport system substrate-binding protein
MTAFRWAAATLPLALVLVVGACSGARVTDPQAARQAADGPARAVPPPPSPTRVPLPPEGAPGEAAAPGAPFEGRETLAPPEGARATVPVAILLPLTGNQAALGADMLDAAQLALFDAGDHLFQLLPYDAQATADSALRAVSAAAADGARLILGPLFAAAVEAAGPAAQARGINVIAFSNDRRVARPGTFLIGVPPDQQVRRVVSFAVSRGLARFAALVPDSDYGDRTLDSLRRAVEEFGGEVAETGVYAADGTNVAEVIRRLARTESRQAELERRRRELEGRDDDASREALRRLTDIEAVEGIAFDALLVPEGGPRLAGIAPLLPYYGIDPAKVRLLGLASWEGLDLGKEPALLGAWFAAQSPAARDAFARRFRAAYGRAPGPIAQLAYDATALAALLARRPGGPDFSAEAIASPNGFAGASGIFRFKPDGEVENGLAVMEVRRDGPRIVAPAPDTFMALQN